MTISFDYIDVMKTMNISDFKAHALQVAATVARDREPVLITKRGKPLAEIQPASTQEPQPDQLKDTLLFEHDIVSPIGAEDWNACR